MGNEKELLEQLMGISQQLAEAVAHYRSNKSKVAETRLQRAQAAHAYRIQELEKSGFSGTKYRQRL